MNCDTAGVSGERFLRLSHAFEAAISYAAVKTTLILIFTFYRTLALFADEISYLLALLVVCLLSVIRVHSCLLILQGERYRCCCHSL